MTVGETLSEARHHAGLSVEEVSERTRIRGTVIRSIEQDDFEACGGDLYVHGYVRAIAGAIGIDAQPLIREYDLGRAGGPNGSAGWRASRYLSAGPLETAETSFDLPVISATQTSLDLPPVQEAPPAQQAPPGDLTVTTFDVPRVTEAGPAGELPAAESPAGAAPTAELPAYPTAEFPAPLAPAPAPPPAVPPDATQAPCDTTEVLAEPVPAPLEDLMAAGYEFGPATTQAGPNPAARGKKRRGIFAVAAAIVVVAVSVLGIRFATGSGNGAASATAPATAPAAKASAAASAESSAESTAAKASAAAPASASAAAKAGPAASQVTRLPVASVMAFGPNGTADGDDPGDAGNVIAARPAGPWTTQWYATAEFGMLKHGTGLLLDLGGNVTVTTVSVDLSRFQGTDLQLRVGNDETPQALQVAATANNVSGSLTITIPHPVAARYLLIWFTKLPPNGAGMFQETVSRVSVTGRR